MLNKVMLIGRLGKDVELRYTQGGAAIANFSVATDESYKDQNGNDRYTTEIKAQRVSFLDRKGEGRQNEQHSQDNGGYGGGYDNSQF